MNNAKHEKGRERKSSNMSDMNDHRLKACKNNAAKYHDQYHPFQRFMKRFLNANTVPP